MSTEMQQSHKWFEFSGLRVTNELFLDLIFTSTCNCNCPFCIARTKDYSVDDFEKWSDSLRRTFELFDIKNIIILGGEATVDPLFFERLAILEKVIEDSSVDNVILTTNGIMLRNDAFLERLTHSCVNSVNISYMHYDHLRNNEIFRNNTLDDAEILSVYKTLKSHSKTMRINTNVYRGNLDTVEEMIAFAEHFSGMCDIIKFSSLMYTGMFDTVDEVTIYTKDVSIPDDDIRMLFDDFSQRHILIKHTENVLGFVDYNELDVNGQRVILKYAQVENKYDRDYEVPTLKLYPNGNLANEWDFRKDLITSTIA